MEAFFLNTENKKRYNIKYVPGELDGGGTTATYQLANIPFSSNPAYFWVSTQTIQRSISIYLDGAETVDDVNLLKSFCKPDKNKNAPSIFQFKIADLPIVKVVFTNVTVSYNMWIKNKVFDTKGNVVEKTKLDKLISRAKVTLQFYELE